MKLLRMIIALSLGLSLFPAPVVADYPERPVKIVVYTAPGGLIDVTARKVAAILQERYLKVPVVVENKKGAGGLVALNHVIRQRPDGYTVFGLTSSVVSRAVGAKKEKMLNELEYLTRVVNEYEAIIVKEGGQVTDLAQLISQAKAKQGGQVWVGPASGGTDHIFAQKFWEAAEVKGRWVPYKSGSEAIASLLGGHGTAYVGNPADVTGREDLSLVAVAAPKRLKQYPEVPTFEELGYPALTHESLWRGFAVRKGTPGDIVGKLNEALASLKSDPEWRKFLETNKLEDPADSSVKFAGAVQKQIESEKKFFNG